MTKKKKENIYLVKKKFNRRRFLEGSLNGVKYTFALPILDYLLNDQGTAFANSNTPITRFGTFYWGLGYGLTNKHCYIPNGAGAGSNWSIPSQIINPQYKEGQDIALKYEDHGLEALRSLKEYLTVFSNYSFDTPNHAPHNPQRGVALSGSFNPTYITSPTPAGFRDRNIPLASIDTLVHNEWKKELVTYFPNLNLSLGVGTNYFTSTSSWEHGGAFKEFQVGALAFYKKITGQENIDQATKNFRNSALDGIKQELASFKQGLSANDRIKLEQHEDKVRTFENQLKIDLKSQCPNLSDHPISEEENRVLNYSNNISNRHQLMADMLVSVLACDLTRVFCFEFTPTQCDGKIGDIGLTSNEGVHDGYSHDDPAGMRKYFRFAMQNLAYLANKMKEQKIGDTNLLDSTLLYCTSECGDVHDNKCTPAMFLGKANGKLKGNYHAKLDSAVNNESPSVLLTAANSMSANIRQLGLDSKTVINRPSEKTTSYATTKIINEVLKK